MSRPLRIEFPGAVYHVMGRGVARMRIFDDETDYLAFLSLLGDLVTDGVLVVYCFCLMPNHPHILCETPFGGLGWSMQQLLGQFSRHYNVRHDRVGHLWQARYRAILVDNGSYFTDCSRYIHLNPCSNKGLVSAPELWPWSSYSNYVGGTVIAPWVSTDRVLSHFGSRQEYRDYVMAGLSQKQISPFERAVGGLAFGGEEFVARIREMEKTRKHRSDVSGRQALLRSGTCPSAELVEDLVNAEFASYSPCKRRQVLGYALHRFSWMKNSDIARLLNLTPAAVTLARGRLVERLSTDQELTNRLAGFEQELRSRENLIPAGDAGATIQTLRNAAFRFQF